MKQNQFKKLIEYIDAAIDNGMAGHDGLHESVYKHRFMVDAMNAHVKTLSKTSL